MSNEIIRVITISDNIVIGVKHVLAGYQLQENEIESEIGGINQILLESGTFVDPEPVPVEPQPHEPTNSELAQMISDLQADLIIAGVI